MSAPASFTAQVLSGGARAAAGHDIGEAARGVFVVGVVMGDRVCPVSVGAPAVWVDDGARG